MRRGATALILLIAFALTSCSSPTPPLSGPRSTAASHTPSAVSTPVASRRVQALPAYSARATGPGCPRTGGSVPADAVTARIGDVDGDGRADIEWAVLIPSGMRFGIRTASHATISQTVQFAGGGTRTLLISRLTDGTVIALPSEERGVQLFAFTHCAFRSPVGANGRPYFFEQGDRMGPGTGTGVGCIAGHLVGFEVTPRGSTASITATRVDVGRDGRTATNGPRTTVIRSTPMSSALVATANAATCGTTAVLTPTFSG